MHFLDTGIRELELLQMELRNLDWEFSRINIRHGKEKEEAAA